jgi:hypothetical protein
MLMQCWNHSDSSAVASCVNCGRALCGQCVPSNPPALAACGRECLAAATQLRIAIESTGRKATRSSIASARFVWIMSAVYAILGLGLILTGGSGLGAGVLIFAAIHAFGGYLYYRSARVDV